LPGHSTVIGASRSREHPLHSRRRQRAWRNGAQACVPAGWCRAAYRASVPCA